MKNQNFDLSKIIDRTGLLFYIMDPDWKIAYISNAASNLIGVKQADVIGNEIFDYFPPDVAKSRKRMISNVLQTREPLSFFDERDGRFFKSMAYPILDEHGQLKQVAVYVQDLTEIKKAETHIEEFRREMESTIKGSPAHVFRFRKDSRGNIVAVLSEGLIADRFGITTKAIKGRNLLELFGQDNFARIQSYYEKAFYGEQVSFEICLRNTWFQTTIAPFERDIDGGIVEVIGYSMDISILKKAQEELERAEKLESLGTLAGGIAHDFNNLLGGLFGFIELARSKIQQDVSAKRYIDSAMQCFSRATDLTHQLLTFAKGGAPEKKIISLEPLIQESINLALSGSAIRYEKVIAKDLYSLEADHGQMNEVFNNILLNARQAMPNGGALTIDACNRHLQQDEIAGMPTGTYVQIRFKDQGTGIAKDILPRVFDPFYTTKQAGSGLGLATSYSIVKKHGGYIGIESELGKGTTVSIILPAFLGANPIEYDGIGSTEYGKGRVLLMDDEEAMRNVASLMLENIGCTVVCVKNGESAIDAYSESIKNNNKFDVIILDLTVIAGMGGELAVARLREIDPDIKAVVSSGYSDSPILSNPKEFGFVDKIAKPYNSKELYTVLSRIFKERQSAGSQS